MKRYDKKQIMTRAWYIYRHSFSPITFGEALKEAWKRAKDEAAHMEAIQPKADRKTYDYRLNQVYFGCRFGRDDWARDYRNDARAAIKRSFANH